jgi:hypothetical protein
MIVVFYKKIKKKISLSNLALNGWLVNLFQLHLFKFSRFFIASGIGLILSLLIFHIGHVHLNLLPFYANLIADLCALIFVFICSWYLIFEHKKNKFNTIFALNIILKLILIYFISVSLSVLSEIIEIRFPSRENFEFRAILLSFSKFLLAPISL